MTHKVKAICLVEMELSDDTDIIFESLKPKYNEVEKLGLYYVETRLTAGAKQKNIYTQILTINIRPDVILFTIVRLDRKANIEEKRASLENFKNNLRRRIG